MGGFARGTGVDRQTEEAGVNHREQQKQCTY